jgi:hypothetical protein
MPAIADAVGNDVSAVLIGHWQPKWIQGPTIGTRPAARRRYNPPMSLRLLTRLALHWLVVISMITTTLVVPVQAATETLHSAAAAQMAAAMADMPCDHMDTSSTTHKVPCDCCTPASCDLSACLGTACLPELPRLVMGIPAATIPVPWNAPAPPARLIDTPLRPPSA